MNIDFGRAQLHLEARELIRLYDPRGARVECVRGALWITQHRDHEDYFLAANDALTLERPGLALIHAQERSRSEEHTSELQSHHDLVCRLLLEKKKWPEWIV